jgi:hypothetical protein
MQTERVTFLTSPDQKAKLDAYAALHGHSVGHVVREATINYIAAPVSNRSEDDAALALILPEVEAAVADMQTAITAMRADIERTCAAVDAVLAGEKR